MIQVIMGDYIGPLRYAEVEDSLVTRLATTATYSVTWRTYSPSTLLTSIQGKIDSSWVSNSGSKFTIFGDDPESQKAIRWLKEVGGNYDNPMVTNKHRAKLLKWKDQENHV